MAGGTVHLLVLPNAEFFHTKLKEKLEKGKIDPYKVKIEPDMKEWDLAEKRIEATNGRVVNVKIDVDESGLDRAEKEIAKRKIELNGNLDIDVEGARAKVLEFTKEAEEEAIVKSLVIDHTHADESLTDFENKWDDPFVRKVLFDTVDSPQIAPEIDEDVFSRNITRAVSNVGKKKIAGVRNLIDYDASLVDTENFMSKMINNMNSQFSIGLKQVYDDYFKTLSKMGNAAKKPFINLQADWSQAKNLNEFFSNLSERSKNAKERVADFSRSMAGKAKEMQKIGKDFAAIPRRLGEEWRMFQGHMPDMSGIFKRNFAKVKESFGEVTSSISDGIKGMKSRLKPDIAKVGEFLKGGFEKTFRGVARVAGARLLGTVYTFTKNIRTGIPFRDLWNISAAISQQGLEKVSQAVSGGLIRMAKGIGSRIAGIGRTLGNWGKAAFGGLQKLFSGLPGLLSKAANGIKAFGAMVGPFFAKIARPFVAFGKKIAAFARGVRSVFVAINGHLRAFAGFARNTFSKVGTLIGRSKAMFAPYAAAASRMAAVVGKGFARMGRIIGQSTKVFGAINKVMGRLGRVASGFSRIAIGAFAKVGGVLTKALLPALGAALAGVLAMGGQAAIGAVAALGGAFMNVAAGGIVMLPALAGAAAVSFAVLKIGAEGLKTAISSAFTAESAEDFEQAISKLPPQMQNIARSVREFKPMWDDIKNTVQENMFVGLDDNFKAAFGNILPIFQAGAGDMATSWNKAFEGALDELASPDAARGMEAIMAGTNEMAKNMEPVLKNLIHALGSLAEQGAKFLGPIGQWAADQSEKFANWADSLKQIDPETGQSIFDGIVNKGKEAARLLGDIFGGLFGTIGNFFKAGSEGGAGMLQGMATAMQELKAYTSEGSAGFEKMVEFMRKATDFASQLGQVVAPLFDSIVSVLTTLASVGEGAIGGIGKALQGLANGLFAFQGIAVDFGKNVGAIFAALEKPIQLLLEALVPVVDGIGEGLKLMLVPALEALTPALEVLKRLGEPIGETFRVVGEALGKILAAAMPILTSFLTILEPLLPILNQIFEWIGKIVEALLIAMEPLFTMRDEAVAGLVEALGPLVDVLGQGLLAVIQALAPVFPILGGLMASLVEAVTPLIEPLTMIAKVLFMALIDVINMVMPILPPIAGLITYLASTLSDILVVALNWLLTTWNAVWPTVSSVLQTVINVIMIPLINLLSSVFQGLASFIKWAIENVIVPVLNFLAEIFKGVINVIKWVIENVAAPVIGGLIGIFQNTVNGIKAVWDGLKAIFSDPIGFMINVVINKGIIGAWNWVDDKLGGKLGHLDPVKIDGFATGGVLKFASGGVLPGYTPGKDVHRFYSPTGGGLELSGGEAIMRPEWTRAVGGKKAVDKMNREAKNGSLKEPNSAAHAQGGVLQRFAEGGIVEAMTRIVQQKYPMLQMTSGYDNRPGLHGMGMAADFSNGAGNTPAQLALAQDIAATYPNSMELIYDAPGWSGNIKNGANVGAFGQFYTMDQAGPHYHHVHWGMNTPPTMPFGGGVFEGGSDGGGGIMSMVANAARKAAKAAIEKIFNPISDQLGQFGEGWGKVLPALGSKAIDSATNFLLDKFGPEQVSGGSSNLDLSGVAGSNLEIGEQLAAQVGWTGAEWEALKELWTNESGWDNNAQNPTSEAYGIAQFLNATWASVGATKTSDPAQQIAAGIKYIQQRPDYGVPSRALALWKSRSPHWYDQGGEGVGRGYLAKNVLSPERVLSPVQTKAFNHFVYGFMPELIEQFRRNPQGYASYANQITEELKRIRTELREGTIASVQGRLANTFGRRLNGEVIANNRIDQNFDQGWFGRNGDKLQQNWGRVLDQVGSVYPDPEAYLEGEAQARAAIDKQRDEEMDKRHEEETKALEERLKPQEEGLTEEINKKKEEETKALKEEREKLQEEKSKKVSEAGEDSAGVEEEYDAKLADIDDRIKGVEESVTEGFNGQKEAIDGQGQAEKDALQQQQEAEKKRVEEARADGSYYYGYKVFNEEGKSPTEVTRTQEEKLAREGISQFGSRTGTSEATSGLMQTFDDVRSIGEAATVATPAWIAALNGDPSGLAHNVAVGQAQVLGNATKEASDLGPEALAGMIEMAVSGATVGQGPLIGQINSGMTQAELMQTMEHYESRRARKGTGTTRVR